MATKRKKVPNIDTLGDACRAIRGLEAVLHTHADWIENLMASTKLLIEWRNDAALRIDTARQEAENGIVGLKGMFDVLHNSLHNHEQRLAFLTKQSSDAFCKAELNSKLKGQVEMAVNDSNVAEAKANRALEIINVLVDRIEKVEKGLELHRLETRREFQTLSDWLAEKEAAPITGKDANPNDFRGFIYPDGKLHHAATDYASNPACRPASGVTVPIEEYRALQDRARNLAEALADLQKIVVNYEAGDRQAKFILIHGNPVDGCEYYGPLDTTEDAEELGDKLGGVWWIKELTL